MPAKSLTQQKVVRKNSKGFQYQARSKHGPRIPTFNDAELLRIRTETRLLSGKRLKEAVERLAMEFNVPPRSVARVIQQRKEPHAA